MCLISILDVMYEIVKQIGLCLPKAKHYFKLPEDHTTPCFLYLLVFNSDTQNTKYVKDVVLDLQVIYFNTKDAYEDEDFEDKLKVMDKLKLFLSTFCLQVKDRNLKFKYNFGESDGQLTINLKFEFKDGVVNIEDNYDLIQNILLNGKEV